MKNKNFAYIILVLNVAAAWVSWWTISNSILGKVDEYVWILPIAAFFIWSVLFSLACALIKGKRLIYGSFVLSLAGYIFFLGLNLSVLALLAAFLMFAAAESKIKEELIYGPRLSFFRAVNYGLKFFVTAVCIVIAFAYYFSSDEGKSFLDSSGSSKSMEKLVDWSLKGAGQMFPDKKEIIADIESGITMDEYLIKSQSKSDLGGDIPSLKEQLPDPLAGSIAVDEGMIGMLEKESLELSKQKISEQLGVEVKGDEKVKDFLVRYVKFKQRDFLAESSSKIFLPILIALGIFLTAKVIGFVVRVFSEMVVIGLIRLFVHCGVVELKTETRRVKTVEYSL